MSTFGRAFRVSTFGESHCSGVGCIVEGVPPRMQLTDTDLQVQLDRRRPGQSDLTTRRTETDRVSILSGVENGYTLGSPISLFVANRDQRPADYHDNNDVPRPSHADFTYQMKYGIRSSSGGGRASARETIARVASGAIAEKWLREKFDVEIVAWVSSIGNLHADTSLESSSIGRTTVDKSLVRCPDVKVEREMIKLVRMVRDDSDSVGGVVTCVCRNVPKGWGEPCFDKLEAKLAHAMLSIPASKAFEIGSGFIGASMRGSAHNDIYVKADDNSAVSSRANNTFSDLNTLTNHSGGVQGGISNGQNIVIRVAFKPPATIGKPQETANFSGFTTVLCSRGRHDPCVVPRAVPIVEAMAALVLADAAILQLAQENASSNYKIIGRARSMPSADELI